MMGHYLTYLSLLVDSLEGKKNQVINTEQNIHTLRQTDSPLKKDNSHFSKAVVNMM